MALIFLGESECSICHKTLNTHDGLIGWQAFLTNAHPLWEFSNSGMHKECFDNWKHKEEFEFLYQYKPCLNIEDPHIQEMIRKGEIPNWLKETLDFRKENPDLSSYKKPNL